MHLAAQLAHHIVESLVDVDAVLGRSLDKITAQLAGERTALLRRDLALRDSVALVANQHDGCKVEKGIVACGRARGLLDPPDLVVEHFYLLKGRAGGYAVHEHKTLSVSYPLISQRDVVFLAGGIEHFEHTWLAVDLHLLAVRVFDGGVVRLDEVV